MEMQKRYYIIAYAALFLAFLSLHYGLTSMQPVHAAAMQQLSFSSSFNSSALSTSSSTTLPATYNTPQSENQSTTTSTSSSSTSSLPTTVQYGVSNAYVINLNSTVPTSGIIFNGIYYQKGSVVNVTGGNYSISAPASKGWAFSYWESENANVAIASPYSLNTTAYISGSGSITANYNSIIKFVETGLPANTSWSISSGNYVTRGTSNILYLEGPPGNYPFIAYNVSMNNSIYDPSPSEGIASEGNLVAINYTLAQSNTLGNALPKVEPAATSTYNIRGNNVTAFVNAKEFQMPLPGNILDSVAVNLTTTGIGINLSISTSSAIPSRYPKMQNPIYNFIQINGTAKKGGVSSGIDKYVSRAIYNFSVPIAWVAQNNVRYTDIKLFKYVSGNWVMLPTIYLGSNATSYLYSATSNSFSAYVVGVATNTNTASSTTSISVTVTGSYPTYIYADGALSTTASNYAVTTSYTLDSFGSYNYSNGASGRKLVANENVSSVGHSTSSTGTFSTPSKLPVDTAIAGIGANVIFSHASIQVVNSSSSVTKSKTLSYTVPATNSFVIFGIASGGSSFSAPLPSGCTPITATDSASDAEAEVAYCTLSSSGSVTITASSPSSISAAAYEWSPATVTLDDNPSTGIILTNSVDEASGNTVQVLGTSTMNAIAPYGYTFGSWSVDSADSSNVVISDPSSPNTLVTIEGNAILTANFKPPSVSLSYSNGIVDAGQSEVLTATVSGTLSGPFTYNYIITNTISGAQVANMLFTGVATSSNTFIWNTAGFAGDTVQANVIVTSASTVISSGNVPTVEITNTISHLPYPYGVAFNPNGATSYVVETSGSYVSAFDVSTNTVITNIFTGSNPYKVAFNPQGTIAYVPNQNSNVTSVINALTNTEVNTIATGSSYGVAFNPKGTIAYVTLDNDPGTVDAINTSTNTIVNTISVGIDPQSVAFNPQGTLAYVLNWGTNTISVINASTETVVNTIYLLTNPQAVVFNPQGTLAYVNECSNRFNGCPLYTYVVVINVSTSKIVNTIAIGPNPFGIAINPQGTLLYITTEYNISVMSTATDTMVDTVPALFPEQIAVNPSGTLAYATDTNYNNLSILSTYPYFTINPSLVFTSFTDSSSQVSAGQQQTVTATVSGGTSPYTYNFLVYNSVGLVANVLYSGVFQTSNSFAFTQQALWGSGPITVNVIVTDSASTPESVKSTLVYNTGTVLCDISLSPTALAFGSTNPGSYLPTNAGVVDTNSGGSNAYMYVYGGNWISGSHSFGVSNTLWSAITQASYTGTQLSATSSNTAMLVPSSGSNTIYFGVAVPASQPSGSYTQNIIIENSC